MKVELTKNEIKYIIEMMRHAESALPTLTEKTKGLIKRLNVVINRPNYCYTPLYVERSVGIIHFGTFGYTPTNLKCDDMADIDATAKLMNDTIGVDESTAYVMQLMSMSKDPNAWDKFDETVENVKQRMKTT